MEHKLTRQDIKRDEVLEGLARTVEFGRRHARWLAWAAVAALAAVLGTLVVGFWWGHRRTEAARALAEALESAVAGPPGATAALEELVGRYEGTRAASIGNALLGQAAAAQGDLATARRRWEAFLEDAPESMLAASVRRNLLELDRAEGRGAEAAAELRAMLEAPAPPLPADLVLFELARSLEAAGSSAEAAEAYRRLVEEHPNSVYGVAARRSLGGSPDEAP
jgi:tetratricopeptide (TPR) repeat protein